VVVEKTFEERAKAELGMLLDAAIRTQHQIGMTRWPKLHFKSLSSRLS